MAANVLLTGADSLFSPVCLLGKSQNPGIFLKSMDAK